MKNRICLCCGEPLNESIKGHYHPSCIKHFFGIKNVSQIILNDEIEQKSIEDNIDQKNSLTGVQKKYSFTSTSFRNRKTIRSKDYQYIIKTSTSRFKNLPEWEYIGMSLASIANILTVEYALIEYSNKYAFITKRIDRKISKGQIIKIQMEDFAQLSNTLTHDKYKGSYERGYIDVIKKYSDTLFMDTIRYFQLIFFSYLIGNTDMHLKNFSLINEYNINHLSLSYDLLPVMMLVSQDEMALSLNGKKKNLTKNDFRAFASYMGLSKKLADKLMFEITMHKNEMLTFLDNCEFFNFNLDNFKIFLKERIEKFE